MFIMLISGILIAGNIFFLSTIPTVCLASSWGPQTEPHGSGITHKTHPTGLPYPSFNNYTDGNNTAVVDNDERTFLVGSNRTKGSNFSNTVFANPGDLIVTRAMVHNNGYQSTANTTAHNVTTKMAGLNQIGKYYFSQAGRNIVLKQTISASNSKPSSIWDTVTIRSASGNPIKLKFSVGDYNPSIAPRDGEQYTKLSATQYFGKGVSIGGRQAPKGGSIRGDTADVMFLFTRYKVVDANFNITDTNTIEKVPINQSSEISHNIIDRQKRVALVVGNNQYKKASLHKPVNDASDMATVLKSLGFQVILKTDVDQREMETAINAFIRQIQLTIRFIFIVFI